MAGVDIPFVGPSYTGRSTNVNAQECINLYPEIDNTEAKNVIALYGTPGLQLFSALETTGKIRGLLAVNSTLYAVCANTLYEIDSDGNKTSRGTIDGSNDVSMVHNGLELFISTGENNGKTAYSYRLSDNDLSLITDPDFDGSDIVAYLDGYFIWNVPDSQKFQISSILDGRNVDALDFSSSEMRPDNIVSVGVNQRELWMFNANSAEVFFNSGNADFPFERVPSGGIEWGCNAARSVASIDNSIIWLSNRNTVMAATSYAPREVSNNAVSYEIGSYDRVDDAIAYTYAEGGHSFYVITFPSADVTWVYDMRTNFWHKRKSFGQGRHRGHTKAQIGNKIYIGDYNSGDVFIQSLDYYTDNGTPIERIRRSQVLHAREDRIFMKELQIDFEEGTAILTGQGSDPHAMLRFSDDGGHTWSNELLASIGKRGQWQTRALWRRLGSFRERVFELRITDPIKVVIIKAVGLLYPGRH